VKPVFKAFFTHFFVIVFFVIAALSYFSPVLQGKQIFQNDIKLYNGMSKEQTDFRKKTGEEPYWTNSAFGGMPTYQLGAQSPHDYVKKLDRLIRFLPRPADYLFLYFLGFYILLCCLKVDYKLAALGALAFGFSTYLIIILGVGHNAKAHALGYLPMLLGGIVLTFRKKYFWGFVLTALAMALEVAANHYQMTYYFMLLVLIVGLAYLIDAVLKKEFKHFAISLGILIFAVGIGVATNATALMATKEYADWSTRSKTELTIAPDGSTKEDTQGLSKDYITEYSYGIVESLNLFVPRLFGGANSEDLGEDSKTYEYLVERGLPRTKALELSSYLPRYWGDQPIVAGPAYIGAVVFFLFILGLILVRGRTKWWLLGGVLMSLVLSWGKNFSALTDFMIDYFPLYDKFRAVSSIQVILELCAPILAVLALVALFKPDITKAKKLSSLMISFGISLGLGICLLLFKGVFDFEGQSDQYIVNSYGQDLLDIVILDRKAVYTSDTLRSLIFVVLAAAMIWLYLKNKLKDLVVIIGMALLMVVDLVGVAKRYVNKDNFVNAREIAQPYRANAIDKLILNDPETFRVFSLAEGFVGARTSYFHQSIGGYHAAKPAGMQELFDYQISKGNFAVLDMLNVKYLIQQNEEGREVPAQNPNAAGNAWFISKLREVSSADEEMKALDSLNVQTEAVVNTTVIKNINRFNFRKDSTAVIGLTEYRPNRLTYQSSNRRSGVAVFSEMYYENGWNAYVNGKLTPHFKVNHVLRALKLPAGDHTIVFKFEPQVIEKGNTITLASSLVFGIVVLAGFGFGYWKSRKKKSA